MSYVELTCTCCGLTVRQRRDAPVPDPKVSGVCGRCVDHVSMAEDSPGGLARVSEHLTRWRTQADWLGRDAAKQRLAATLAQERRDELALLVDRVAELHRPVTGRRCSCGLRHCRTLDLLIRHGVRGLGAPPVERPRPWG